MKKALFAAESLYQLFNAVTIRLNCTGDVVCDLVLGHQTQWRMEMLERLNGLGLFRMIKVASENEDCQREFFEADTDARRRIYANPDEFFKGREFAAAEYDELYFPLDHLPWRMFYYWCCRHGCRPEVHMFDEGVRAYTLPVLDCENSVYATDAYPIGSRFVDAIRAYHLHRPSLYSVPKVTFDLFQIPSPASDARCKAALTTIFGTAPIPDQKYIYLEDFFFADRCLTNDFQLFERFVELVGADSVIVKRHPRDKFNRFEAIGVEEVPDSLVPWESQLLSADYSGKVLISVTSTALMTPCLIFDYPMHVVSLENMFVGKNPTHDDKAFTTFMEKFRLMANADEIRWHSPRNLDELRDVLAYIDLKMGAARQ